MTDLSFRKVLVGSVALLILALVYSGEPSKFNEFVRWSIMGILLSSLFLIPTFRIIVTGKVKEVEITSYALGILVAVIYSIMTSPYQTLILFLQWVAVYAFISTIVVAFEEIVISHLK